AKPAAHHAPLDAALVRRPGAPIPPQAAQTLVRPRGDRAGGVPILHLERKEERLPAPSDVRAVHCCRRGTALVGSMVSPAPQRPTGAGPGSEPRVAGSG